MVAERKNTPEPQRTEHLTLVALYELEERANELLDRLSAINIDTSEATIVRVQPPSQPHAAQRSSTLSASPFPPAARSAVTGAIIGGGVALLAGLVLYEVSLFSLSFIEGLFLHVLIATFIGAATGAALGALLASARKSSAPPSAVPIQEATSEGFLVVIKTPPHLAEQAEAIARRLEAKEILL